MGIRAANLEDMMKVLLLACAITLTSQACSSEGVTLPVPSGGNGVGTTHLLFIDRSRPELFTDDPDDMREVTVRAWYPADPAPDASPAPYYEDADAMVRNFSYPERLKDIITHSLPDVPLAQGEDPYPVILFNHGWGEHAVQNTVLMEDLASHGYAVFSIAHHYEAKYWAYPDGRIEYLNIGSSRFQEIMREQGHPDAMPTLEAMFQAREVAVQESVFRYSVKILPTLLGESPRHWAEDIAFVIDELDSLNNSPGLFEGRLDLDRLGVMGMSMGGAAAGQVCLIDDRIKAAINMDGGLIGDLADTVVARPMMYAGSRRFIGYDEVFSAHASDDTYTLIVPDADHYDFTDFTLLHPDHMLMGTVDGELMLGIMNIYTRSFFDFYLKGVDSDILTGKKKPYAEVDYYAHRRE
jgi:predicted dienelactone hydrolase